MWNNLKDEQGSVDRIGDGHGCFDALQELLEQLGYEIHAEDEFRVSHHLGRKVVFLGDLVDRGPAVPNVLRLVMSTVGTGSALCIPGNHDVKLLRKLNGNDVRLTHGLAASVEQLEYESAQFLVR